MTGKARAILSEKFPGLIRCRRKHDPFRIMEAIFYLLRSGCQWRLLPACYPHWKSVYNKWRYWHSTGIFKRIHTFLLRHARKRSGRNEMPSVCHIDSASRRSGLSDSVKGIDGFKKVKGIKRHLVVDSHGNILHIHTTCANVNDGKACLVMIPRLKHDYPTLSEIRADKGYAGLHTAMTAGQNGMRMVCVKSGAVKSGFIPARGRWVVERSFSWLDNCRRLVRNYERGCVTATYMTLTAEIYRLLRFL